MSEEQASAKTAPELANIKQVDYVLLDEEKTVPLLLLDDEASNLIEGKDSIIKNLRTSKEVLEKEKSDLLTSNRELASKLDKALQEIRNLDALEKQVLQLQTTLEEKEQLVLQYKDREKEQKDKDAELLEAVADAESKLSEVNMQYTKLLEFSGDLKELCQRNDQPADKPVPDATLQVTGAVGWRREGLVYKKNEVSLDIVESVNLLMSSKGSVLRCDVTGKILMKCFLSGMPDLKLGLNDKIGLEKESQLKSRPTKSGKTIELDDVTFHQCVNLTRFNSEKTVSFVPPDGEFELMKYRITEGVNLRFRVLPAIKELGRTHMEVNVKVKSVFGAKTFALGVVVKIPVPKQTAKTSFQVTSGRAKYDAAIDCLVWNSLQYCRITKFPGQTETTLSAEVELISTMTEKKSVTRPPVQMEFQVPMFTASGLRVCFLKVWEKSGYNTVEQVRYITKAGSYEIRC